VHELEFVEEILAGVVSEHSEVRRIVEAETPTRHPLRQGRPPGDAGGDSRETPKKRTSLHGAIRISQCPDGQSVYNWPSVARENRPEAAQQWELFIAIELSVAS
jgi:hypothetical protein